MLPNANQLLNFVTLNPQASSNNPTGDDNLETTRHQSQPQRASTIAPTLSIVIATHNRRDAILATLQKLSALHRETADAQIILVDNASTDNTAETVAKRFPAVHIIGLTENKGSCAKAYGADEADGEFVLFLDDDSYPRPGSIDRMFDHFAADPTLAAAGFRVQLPDGREESSALPGVFVGCGVGLRRSALIECGGLDRDLFMQAEEYDLCFRLTAYGWRTEVLDDLHVHHEKSPQSRCSARRAYLDTYNNLLVAARYIPDQYLAQVLDDWTTRYAWLYHEPDQAEAVNRAIAEGRAHRQADRQRFASHRLKPEAIEHYFNHNVICNRMLSLRHQQVQRILLARFGKNIHPFVAGAQSASVQIAAIADDTFASPNRAYRRVPILPISTALKLEYDAVIIADSSPAHASAAFHQFRRLTDRPVHALTDPIRPDSRRMGEEIAVTATA